MQWMVGSSGTITEDQLLSSKDKYSVGMSAQRSLHTVTQILEEAVELGVYPTDVLREEASNPDLTSTSKEISGQPASPKTSVLMKLDEFGKKLDHLRSVAETNLVVSQRGFREVLKNQKKLHLKIQDSGDIFLQDKERTCPRFIFLGEKNSSRWMTLKEALSPSVSARLHFACEARYDDYQQHAVKDQQDAVKDQPGIKVSHVKKWAETIAPWLKVTVAALYISARIAANVLAPGTGYMLLNFGDWQQASSLSEALASATGFSEEALNKHLIEGMGLDANNAKWDPRELYGKSRAAMSNLLGRMTAEAYEEKLGLRKVCLCYGDGSLHGIVWICSACFEKFKSSSISITEA